MGLFCDVRWLWDQLRARLDWNDRRLVELQEQVQRIWMWTRQPSSIGLVVFSEGANGMFKFKVALPYRPDNDNDWNEISGGKLVVTIGETGTPITLLTPKEIQENVESDARLLANDEFVAEQGTAVTLRFSYLDDAVVPNESTFVERTQIITDTVPPVPPTSIGLIEVEEFYPAPTPEPEPQPEPDPTPEG